MSSSNSQWDNIKEESTSTQQSLNSNLPKKSILKNSIINDGDIVSNDSQSRAVQQSAVPSHFDQNDSHDLTSITQTLLDKSNRTVSFAPDVTLHSFDFVVNKNTNNNNVTSLATTKNNPNLVTPIKIKPALHRSVQEKDDDSMTMELTNPINVPDNNYNNNTNDGKNKTTVDTIEREEKMSPIPLSINIVDDNFENKNDSTMELTEVFNSKIISNTNNNKEDNNNSSNNNNNPDTMDFTQIPFIHGASDTENMDLTQISKHVPNKFLETDENSMDFTQTYKNNMNKPSTETSSNLIIGNQNEKRDFTQINLKENNQEKQEDTETEMQLTQPYYSNLNELNINNFNDNKQDLTEHEMEFTQIRLRDNNNHNNNESEGDSEMDLTNISSHFSYNKNDDKINNKNIITNTATNNDVYSISSKRSRENDNEENQTYTPKKSSHDNSNLVSNAEQMSPIKFNELNTNNYIDNNDSASKHYSLVKFLTDIESNFIQAINAMKVSPQPVSLNVTENKTMDLTHNKLSAVLSLYSDIPWLQMITFMAKELIIMNEKSQHVISNLQIQISNSKTPPLLLKRYYDSTDNERKSIKEQLGVIKLYSSLEAKKSWYKWQLSNLENVKIILKENLSLLKLKSSKLNQKLNQFEHLYNQIITLRESLKNDIITHKNSIDINLKEVSLDNKIKLAKLKRYMEVHKANVKELPTVINKKKQLSTDILKLNETLNKLKRKYQNTNVDEYQKEQLSNFKLRDKLNLWGNLTGIHFVKIANDAIILKIPFLPMEISLEIQLKNDFKTFISSIPNHIKDNSVRVFFLTQFQNKYDHQQLMMNIIHSILLDIKMLFPVLQHFYLLQGIFTTHLKKHDDKNNEYLIELKQMHFESNQLILYHIPLLDFKSFVCGNSENLSVYVSPPDKETMNINELMTLFTTKTRHVIPLLNKNRITLIPDTIPF